MDMTRLLVASFLPEGDLFVRNGRMAGMSVRVLDCSERHHRQLAQWYGDALLHTQGRRNDVREVVAKEQFDAAIVHEDADFFRSALITQSLREAGVRTIIVVTIDASRRTMYRRFGAHRIVTADNAAQAWETLYRFLPSIATALEAR